MARQNIHACMHACHAGRPAWPHPFPQDWSAVFSRALLLTPLVCPLMPWHDGPCVRALLPRAHSTPSLQLELDYPNGTAKQLHKCIVSHASGKGVFDGNVKVR